MITVKRFQLFLTNSELISVKIATYSKNPSFAADSQDDERTEDETKMVKESILQHRVIFFIKQMHHQLANYKYRWNNFNARNFFVIVRSLSG